MSYQIYSQAQQLHESPIMTERGYKSGASSSGTDLLEIEPALTVVVHADSVAATVETEIGDDPATMQVESPQTRWLRRARVVQELVQFVTSPGYRAMVSLWLGRDPQYCRPVEMKFVSPDRGPGQALQFFRMVPRDGHARPDPVAGALLEAHQAALRHIEEEFYGRGIRVSSYDDLYDEWVAREKRRMMQMMDQQNMYGYPQQISQMDLAHQMEMSGVGRLSGYGVGNSMSGALESQFEQARRAMNQAAGAAQAPRFTPPGSEEDGSGGKSKTTGITPPWRRFLGG